MPPREGCPLPLNEGFVPANRLAQINVLHHFPLRVPIDLGGRSGQGARHPGENAAATISCSSKPNSPRCKPNSHGPSATFPPQDAIAASPGQYRAARRDPPDLSRAETVEKCHGRIERIRELKDRCSREVIYAIIILAADKRLDPARLLQLSRDHWAIENSLFHVRDVSVREDACRVRSGSAPQALAAIRDGMLSYIRRTGQKPRPARKTFAASTWKAIRLDRRE
jgi:predicted transposase YbfD/YdcC